MADLIEIGYGSQCWKLDVTPNGNALNERRLSSALLSVPLVNSSHSCLRIASTLFGSTGIDQVRFTNSGTESTMYAVRVARSATEKMGILKVEGGYHGSYDPFVVSSKPALDKIGDPEDPTPAIDLARVIRSG